jgi:two-component system response regulator HydG
MAAARGGLAVRQGLPPRHAGTSLVAILPPQADASGWDVALGFPAADDLLLEALARACRAPGFEAVAVPALPPTPAPGADPAAILGTDESIRRVLDVARRVADTGVTILITGESGTGKSLLAREIHAISQRRTGRFVEVACGSLPESLLESELFGHVAGAFTGATVDREGRFAQADGGTIFLDEIGDIPQATQVRLLRVLQEGEVKRVGANDTLKVDVRVIAATNVDLSKAKDQGKFREDLFYRLNVITVQLPPLRDRPEDIPLLAQHFLKLYVNKIGKKIGGISPAAMEALTTYRWNGNVRELENALERAVVLCAGDVVDVEELPNEIRTNNRGGGEVEVFSLAHLPYAQAKKLAMRAFERRYLSALLEKSSNNVSMAARAAGVDRSNFRRLLKQYEVGGRSMKKGEGMDDGDDEEFDDVANG